MLNGIKGKLNDDIMIVTGVTGGEIVSWFYPLLICSDFRYIIISIESLDGTASFCIGLGPFPAPGKAGTAGKGQVCLCPGCYVFLRKSDRRRSRSYAGSSNVRSRGRGPGCEAYL